MRNRFGGGGLRLGRKGSSAETTGDVTSCFATLSASLANAPRAGSEFVHGRWCQRIVSGRRAATAPRAYGGQNVHSPRPGAAEARRGWAAPAARRAMEAGQGDVNAADGGGNVKQLWGRLHNAEAGKKARAARRRGFRLGIRTAGVGGCSAQGYTFWQWVQHRRPSFSQCDIFF